MTVTDILKSMRFLVDQKGKPTAVVLDMDAWEAFRRAKAGPPEAPSPFGRRGGVDRPYAPQGYQAGAGGGQGGALSCAARRDG